MKTSWLVPTLLLLLALASCAPHKKSVELKPLVFAKEDFFSTYRFYPEVEEYLQGLCAVDPEMFRLKRIGQSTRGRDLYAVEIGARAVNAPALLIEAAHHGNEIIGSDVALYFLKYLVEHRNDPKLKTALERNKILLLPCVNPDGYSWRIRANFHEVDLNRNYPAEWKLNLENQFQNSGDGPLSEPESKAVAKFVQEFRDIRISVSLHSGIDRVMTCGLKKGRDRQSEERFNFLANESIKRSAVENCAPSMRGNLTIAPAGGASGIFPAWMHLRGAYALIFELYGDGKYPWTVSNKHTPPEANIATLCKRWMPSLIFLLSETEKE